MMIRLSFVLADFILIGFQHNIVHVDKVPPFSFWGMDEAVILLPGYLYPLSFFYRTIEIFFPKIPFVHFP